MVNFVSLCFAVNCILLLCNLCTGTLVQDCLFECGTVEDAKQVFASFTPISNDVSLYRHRTKVTIASGQITKLDGSRQLVVKKSCPLYETYACMLLKEMQILQKLNEHDSKTRWFPRLSPFLFLDPSTNALGFVMERMPGITLMQWLERADSKKNLSIRHLNTIVFGMRKVLQFLESNNVFHMDVSATNIIVNKDGISFSIVDFGIAQVVEPGKSIPRGEFGLYRFEKSVISDRNFDFLCLKEMLKSIATNSSFGSEFKDYKNLFVFKSDDEFMKHIVTITIDDCSPLQHDVEQKSIEDCNSIEQCNFLDLHVELIDTENIDTTLLSLQSICSQVSETRAESDVATETPQKRRIATQQTKAISPFASRIQQLQCISNETSSSKDVEFQFGHSTNTKRAKPLLSLIDDLQSNPATKRIDSTSPVRRKKPNRRKNLNKG